ncbi:methylmalonyl-CoA mutase, small subunit [Propionibacterium sp. oral taxon 192 str. F0372]|uniref:methylmalonyl-CoA mutase small subunit n=1 Tax=Propionibacterium sp. oral taxon 192 TaxID=671222 RepID=UPI000352963C|nr:methylmalonyl-CoA mutase small subunit [Propionibacterium sp. oral taxon 192]EPH07091.1 methylmalonyl-CoA mutase, small subunit [Propionibacterium sp. oral taxon 192 str. F0372]
MTTPTPPAGSSAEDLVLAGDFGIPTYDQWAAEVAKVLNKGRPENKLLSADQAIDRLRVHTVDGLTIEPIYTEADAIGELGAPGTVPFTRGTTVRSGEMDAWDVRALHEDPDAARTREAIATDLERGATSIWLRVDPDAVDAADLGTVLADVLLELAKVEVSSRTDQAAAANALLAYYGASDKPKNHLSLNLGIDPIGVAALNGTAADLSDLAHWVSDLEGFKDSQAFVVDGTIYHNAGAGDVHEVAWVIATAVEYVRALVAQGISVDDAFDAISFRVSATTDQVATIARLRALRTVWARVGEVFGVTEAKRGARQHAVTSWREITRDDAYVNILRATIETFSAAIGGAEAITVLPFDTAWGLPAAFSRRVARNTQVVLAEESNIGRVNDPAGGGWYFESLTNQIAQAAWTQFQAVEAAGGMAAYLASGEISKTLEDLNAKRAKLLATRKQPITGVSEFPNPTEAAVTTALARPAAPEYGGLVWRRDSEVFEQLRDATKDSGAKVFLACLGTRRDFGGREGFASNYFHIAGLETPSVEGGTTEEIVAAWKASGTPVVALCSSAKVYAVQGFEVAKALKEAGAAKVILAGNIKELGDVSTDGVIDGTIALGMDVVAGLSDVLNTLGVNK